MQLISYLLLLSSLVQYIGLVVYINLKSHHVTQVSKSFKYRLLICFTVVTLLVIYNTSVNKGDVWTKSGQHTTERGLEGSYQDQPPPLEGIVKLCSKSSSINIATGIYEQKGCQK